MRKSIFFVFVIILRLGSIYGQEYSIDENIITNNYIKHFSNIGFISGKLIINNGYLPLLYTLHDTDLAVLNKNDLRILRNTIYAKYGLIFQSKDLKDHFSQFIWYKSQYSDVDKFLSNNDRRLIQTIQAFENAVQNNKLTKKELVGKWLGQYPVASGAYNDINIYDDDTIEFGYNTMSPKAVFYSKGTYRIENGFLVVLITEQKIWVGDYFHEGYASIFGGMEENIGGKLIFDTPIRMVFPIGNIRNESVTYYGRTNTIICCQIGSYDRVKN
jgi:hypothetical protein